MEEKMVLLILSVIFAFAKLDITQSRKNSER